MISLSGCVHNQSVTLFRQDSKTGEWHNRIAEEYGYNAVHPSMYTVCAPSTGLYLTK